MKLLILVLAISLLGQVSFANDKCKSVVGGSKFSVPMDQVAASDPTSNFISYLEKLLESSILMIEDLQEVQASLVKSGLLINPISSEKAGSDTALSVHNTGLEEILVKGGIDHSRIENWLEKTLQGLIRDSNERGATSLDTADPHKGYNLLNVKKGSLWFGGGWKRVSQAYEMESQGVPPAEIEKKLYVPPEYDPMEQPNTNLQTRHFTLLQDILVTPELITQEQWQDVMGELPKDFSERVTDNELHIKGKDYVPDSPITGITFWSMLEFANRMSEEIGLTPVYDMSDIDFEGRAEDGNLRPKTDPTNPYTYRQRLSLKINSQNSDYYAALGYRLPTAYESAYLFKQNLSSYNRRTGAMEVLFDWEYTEHNSIPSDNPSIQIDHEFTAADSHGLNLRDGKIYENKEATRYDLRKAASEKFGRRFVDILAFGEQGSDTGFRLVRSLPEGSLK